MFISYSDCHTLLVSGCYVKFVWGAICSLKSTLFFGEPQHPGPSSKWSEIQHGT
jgi:hypothetical protein